MKNSGFSEVSRAEFIKFVQNYPRPLEYDVTMICDPPMGSHNDFSNGQVWPESMVTKVSYARLGNQVDKYYIKNEN